MSPASRSRWGFTLVETVVAIAVGSLVLTGIGYMFGMGRSAAVHGERLDDLSVAARLVLAMEDDLASVYSTPATTPFATGTDFVSWTRIGPNGTENVRYQLEPHADGQTFGMLRNNRRFVGAVLTSFEPRFIDEGDLVALVVNMKLSPPDDRAAGRRTEPVVVSIFRALSVGLSL